MERLMKIGQVIPKDATSVCQSKLGLGFEKLDREVFDPEKAYDPVAELGVKWIRIQSGWARTERQKGVYDFSWLDTIVDNLLKRGLTPWMCLCYGNGLYDEAAAQIFGAVGCPPIHTSEQKAAWTRYVEAVVQHFQGRIFLYEVWNEPDGKWCWKHGVNATELGLFTRETAQAIKRACPEAKVVGGAVCQRDLHYLNEALKTGMWKYIDFVSFHEYTADESRVFERVKALRALIDCYDPTIGLIQGESGSQSRSGGRGALWPGAWSEEKQAKQLARHLVSDLITGVYLTSYFSCLDMIEALNGNVNDQASYLDYGYFGVLGAEFDENGHSVGNYYKKPSFYVLQNLASIFAGDFAVQELPVLFTPEDSVRIFGRDTRREQVITGGFSRPQGQALAYWYPADLMTSTFEGTVSFEIFSPYDEVRLIDVMSGTVYKLPESIQERDAHGTYHFHHLPILDSPLLLTFGTF